MSSATKPVDLDNLAEVPADIKHKYGKPGGKVKTFTTLNNPEPNDDGIMRYALFQVTIKNGERQYEKIADNLTTEEADAYVAKNGQWDA